MLDVMRGLQAMLASAKTLDLNDVAKRNAAMVRELARFSFPDIAAVAGGLLTYPENQSATFRLEALISLAAIHAMGVDKPTSKDLARWLNGSLLSDPLGQQEDPTEDVFVSNVPSWNGNARLFDGLWGDNDVGAEALVWATMRLKNQEWAATALDQCMAMLALSEEIADRAGIPRYTRSTASPRTPIDVSDARIDEARARVTFEFDDLMRLGIRANRVVPFGLTTADREALMGQSIGHSDLERRPLIRHERAIIVVMPTAIGAAIRRQVLDAAADAGALAQVEAVIADKHFTELRSFGLTGFRARLIREPGSFAPIGRDLVATFDEGAYLHLVYAGEALDDFRINGHRSLQILSPEIGARVAAVTAELRDRPDYQRGLTVIVHGGLGRGFSIELTHDEPDVWRSVGVSIADIARIIWEHGFNALRLWKILDQEAKLPERGYRLDNINGFANLYGFLRGTAMVMVPDVAAPGGIRLATDHVGTLRAHLRSLLDPHVAISDDGTRWVEVQRSATDVFFDEVKGLPLFVDRYAVANGELTSCVETARRPWWVSLERGVLGPVGMSIVYQLWDMVQNWMLRTAQLLEDRFTGLPEGPIRILLTVPDVESFDSDAAPSASFGPPHVERSGNRISVRCGNDYLNAFARADNVAERSIVAGIAGAVATIAGEAMTGAEAESFALEVIGSTSARFFHMFKPRTPTMQVYAAAGLSRPRLLQDEDIAWGRLQLAEAAGWTAGPGAIPFAQAPAILKAATVALLRRVEALMQQLDREALVMRLLINHDAVVYDRFSWQQTAAALLALYRDQADIIGASNGLEVQRGIAGLAARVLAEMAVCIAPVRGGRVPSDADLDQLYADLAIMVECANQDDAIHWGLAVTPPFVNDNGSLSFDETFRRAEQTPYINAHGERAFRSAARAYPRHFEVSTTPAELQADPDFLAAILDEYGLDLLAFARFAMDLANEAAAAGVTVLKMSKSELIKRLHGDTADCPAHDPDKAFNALALKPRPRWDEVHPEGARKRDWYPWRFNRRLSLVHRPIVQIGEGDDPLVLIAPALVDHFITRFFEAEQGLVPVELFTGDAMRSWIGAAVNRDGHAFNKSVADEMERLGWTARSDVKLTELGGTKALGDVDVLAWHEASGVVVAIECKRLQVARSIGEIGERLAEYTTLAPPGGRKTPIEKNLNRLAFLRANPQRLAKLTRIPQVGMSLRSALVTDHLVPMLFSAKAGTMVDVIAEFSGLAAAFPIPDLAA
ncbi:hypothetical protein [Sandarakinorhabdus sp. DWP1-3-1]|uniref:hypothetical protein n=1 Tax=Sandarakinorhabdus sp. DWP1-3-1 TaxID=2804627 RepID=UPI003CF37517